MDAAFFAAQQAQSVTRVAEQTVATRQMFLDQVSALATNKLRSELDVSFAKVNVDDARLLLSKAQNDVQAEFARLANLYGLARSRRPSAWSRSRRRRPFRPMSRSWWSRACNSGRSCSACGTRGTPPSSSPGRKRPCAIPPSRRLAAPAWFRSATPQLPDNYAAAGVSMTLPLYTGGLYAARQQEAELRAQAAEESLRDLENNVIRDVRIAWLNAQNAFDRLRITAELLDNAKLSYDLAQARYNNRHQFDRGVQPGPAQPAFGADHLCQHPIRIPAPALRPELPDRLVALTK